MSTARLLDEVVLKGGHGDGYSILNAMLTEAGFTKDMDTEAMDAGAIADGANYCTQWTLMQQGWRSPIRLYLRCDKGKEYFAWRAVIYSLATNAYSSSASERESPVKAIVSAYTYARAKTPDSPRTQALLTALDKLEVSPRRAEMERLFSRASVKEAVMRNGSNTPYFTWLNKALSEAGFRATKDTQPVKLPHDGWVGNWHLRDGVVPGLPVSRLSLALVNTIGEPGTFMEGPCWECYLSINETHQSADSPWTSPFSAIGSAMLKLENLMRHTNCEPGGLEEVTWARQELIKTAQRNRMPDCFTQ